MKSGKVLLFLSVASLVDLLYAYPGMAGTLVEIQRSVHERRGGQLPRANTKLGQSTSSKAAAQNNGAKAPSSNSNTAANGNSNKKNNAKALEPAKPDDDPETGEQDNDGSGILLGDIKDGGSSPIGKTIARILLEQESAQSLENKYTPPASLGQPACKKDTCCQWYWAANTMSATLLGKSGRCNSFAREAIRLGFHDAGTWSQKLASQGKDFGGADGSIVLAAAEIKRAENNGLKDIIDQMWAWSSQFSVGMADLIQFAAAVAVVTCPLGPRMRVFVGRKDSSKAAPDGLLPDVNDSADKLISLFQDKTISPHALVALLGAHTTSEQFFVDSKRAGAPQEWNARRLGHAFLQSNPRSQSSSERSVTVPIRYRSRKRSRTADEWKSFSGSGGQNHWNTDYAFAYTRLSLLGVNNINDLKECTKVLPMPKTNFREAGELLKDQ